MPKSSVDALVRDLNSVEKVDRDEDLTLRARWDGDDFVVVDPAHVVDPAYPRPGELRVRPDRRGLYPIGGGITSVGVWVWEWLEVIPPWPGDPVDAATIVALLEARSPHPDPIRHFIEARAEIAEIVGAFALTNRAKTLMDLCDVVHHRRVGAQGSDGNGTSDTAPAVPALLALLDHESGGVRSYAADALSGIAAEQSDSVRAVAPDAPARLFDHIRSQGDEGYLDDLLHVLGAIGALDDHEAIPNLIELLDHDASFVRRRAATALGDLRASAAAPRLKQALAREPNSDTQDAIVDALGAVEATE